MFEIINTEIDSDITEDFIAIGSYIDGDKMPYHSVLIIQYKNNIQHFHYTGELLLDAVYNKSCFHIKLDVIEKALVPAFLAMCRRILKKANITYGYFYSGEYYDYDGVHFSAKNIGETMTCVGLCLNVLKGFLGKDYVSFEDWTDVSMMKEGYLENFADRYHLDIDKISRSHRRITPVDLLCSAYFTQLPISKNEVDSKRDEVMEYLKNY